MKPTLESLTLENLGRLLKEKRGSRGIREAAREIGISHATLSRVERGHLPDLENYQKICKWMGIDMSAIGAPLLPEPRRLAGGRMSFEGRDIPKFQRKGSRWKEMADYLLANPSRAAFVAAEEGKSLKRVRSSGQHALCRYIPRVQSTIQDGGVYFWIPREKLSHDAIGCPFVPAGDIPRKFVPRENK